MKILFLDSAHPSLKQVLEKNGFSCEEDVKSSRELVEKKISSFDGLVLRSRFNIDKAFIDAGKNLKFVARVGAGMEHIDVAYAESRGVKCLSSPEGNRNAVAEHALGMLLSLMNNICRANAEVKNGEWKREPNRATELEGKTVGIYGYGNTGSAFAKVLRGFDVKVLAYDKYKSNFSQDHVRESTPAEIFAEADIVSLHLPLADDTKFLVNDVFLSKFKRNIYLINTSRGPVVNTGDLVKNLKAGKVLGACLDVLEYEESSFEFLSGPATETMVYLQSSDRVVLTPHIAGWSHESAEKMARMLAQKIVGLKDL